MLVALLVVLTLAIRLQSTVAAIPITPTTASVAAPAPDIATPTPEITVAPTPEPTAASVQNCTPANANARPSAINLSSAPQGMSQVIDTPTYYQIFGNTAAQIQTQLRSCAPLRSDGEAFAGETAYTLTWQYASTNIGDGLCTISNVKIGLHVTMSLPKWSPTTQATSGLATKWQNFISNLSLHENGHATLSTQHANQLLNDLQDHPPTDCATLNTSAQTKAHATLDSLNAANEEYDNHTNHGATQGAILP